MSCGPHKIRQIVPNCPEKLVHLPSLHLSVIKDLYKLDEGIALTLTVFSLLYDAQCNELRASQDKHIHASVGYDWQKVGTCRPIWVIFAPKSGAKIAAVGQADGAIYLSGGFWYFRPQGSSVAKKKCNRSKPSPR